MRCDAFILVDILNLMQLH